MDEGGLTGILADMTATEIATLIQNLPDDDQAYILTTLPDERAQEVLRLMKPEESAEVKDLLKYEPQTAGAIMTGEYFALPANTTVQEAIRKLQSTDIGNIFYVYVTDKEEKLIGVLSLRQLLGSPDRTLGSMITKEVISVTPETDQEEVAKQVARYNLLAIPVVEKDNTLVGIITVDDVVDVMREEATEDMMKMAGTTEEDSLMKSSSLDAARRRLPWLFTNLAGSLCSGAILWYFRYTIQEVVAIVSVIPVI